MKFIKTVDGDYLFVSAIQGLTISPRFEPDTFSVVAKVGTCEYAKLYSCKSETEAWRWLDELVAKLNAEELSHVET